MKIEDLLGKTLATGTDMARKAKTAAKPQANSSGSTAEKTTPQRPAERVDAYEPGARSAQVEKPQVTPPAVDSVPVRPDRVARAKQLVAAGAYDREEVIDKIIDRLMETIREA